MKVLLFLLAAFLLVGAEKVRYDGHKVYRITPKTQEAVDKLIDLEQNSDEFDFWTRHIGLNHSVDIMVAPHLSKKFSTFALDGQFGVETFISDVQELIDQEQPKEKSSRALDWTSYQTLSEINEWLTSLEGSYPGIVTVIDGGISYAGRRIFGVRLRFAPGNEQRSVFIEGNIHAREWITSAIATWVINELLTSTNQATQALAASHDWYIFPIVNPDGYEFSQTTDRLWRKTRVPYGNTYGADPNRNWDYFYNNGGTSNLPTSETYRGPYAFSEPSTRTLSEFISTLGTNLEAFISFHSYSQLLLLPYGYTTTPLDNYNELKEVGTKAIASLATRYGTVYDVGNIPEVLYVASGGSMDWVKGTFGTRITYTYEVRDTGRFGFVLPADQILPTALETWDSVLTIFSEFDSILEKEKAGV